MPEMQLQSSDGEVFRVDLKAAGTSDVLRAMIEERGIGSDWTEADIVPLPTIKSDVLKKVLEWSDRHKSDPLLEDINGDRTIDFVTDWDKSFFDGTEGHLLLRIVLAADYLDMKLLLAMGCKAVAGKISGKSPEQIREAFKFSTGLNPEEEDKIKGPTSE